MWLIFSKSLVSRKWSLLKNFFIMSQVLKSRDKKRISLTKYTRIYFSLFFSIMCLVSIHLKILSGYISVRHCILQQSAFCIRTKNIKIIYQNSYRPFFGKTLSRQMSFKTDIFEAKFKNESLITAFHSSIDYISDCSPQLSLFLPSQHVALHSFNYPLAHMQFLHTSLIFHSSRSGNVDLKCYSYSCFTI